jgi:outer membrane receptor protein involved in Fe transport
MFCNRNHLALVIGVLLSAGIATPASAQSADAAEKSVAATLDSVTVTGSNIKGAAISGVGPVSIIDAEAIERSGAISVETLLQRIPASAGSAGSQTSAYWTGDGWGTAQVNLRGLGASRTLVLINGRRMVNGGTGANSAVDLNTIPLSMIERIEVLKDGASAIYGADAVAGVVNIITKRKFDGAKLAVMYGQTAQGDGEETSADLTFGTNGERGSILLGVTYNESKAVPMASRAPCNLAERGGELVCVGSSATTGGRAVLADGTMVNFNQTPGGNGDAYERYDGSKHNVNNNGYLNAVNPVKRYGVTALGEYDLTEDTRLYGEFLYTNRSSHQSTAPGTVGTFRTIRIGANHPTNPTGQDLTLIRRNLKEAGPRIAFQDVDTFRGVLGLEGAFGETWSWDASMNYGRNTAEDGFTNVVNLDRFDATLDRSRCSTTPGAAIPCADYLGYGDLTQEAIDYITYKSINNGGNSMMAFQGKVSGQLFELPAGTVGMAAGVEVRTERGWRNPDILTQQGIANTNRADIIAGEYKAKEAFVEWLVPLLADMPLVQRLDLSAAVRYSDYELFGDDTNYKLGLDWQMTDSFKIRGTTSTAFRVPSIPQLFGGVTTGNLTTTDPCSGWSSMPSSSVVAQNCKADGVPPGYTQLGNMVLTYGGGNIDLKPEDAKTLTVGMAWTPTFTDGLTLTLDYYKIDISNAVASVAGSTKLAICYNTPGMAHPFCSDSNFTRNPVTGEIDYLSSRPVNAADETASGVDLGLVWQFPIGGLQALVDLDMSYLKEYSVRPYANANLIEYAGKITGGRGSYAHWRGLGTFGLTGDRWSGNYTVQFIGKAEDINASKGDIGASVGNIFYHNLQADYSLTKAIKVSAGIDNLFDKSAPFIQSYTDANTDTMTYDLLGRRWNLRFSYSW